MKKLIIVTTIMIVGILSYWAIFILNSIPEKSILSQEEALAIAQQNNDCSMTGILTDEINYNTTTKTWWIDLERVPELEKDGCNPACVVDEETKKAEVNWRCTGLLPEMPEEAIKRLFAVKYDKDISEITLTIKQKTENHIRGGVVLQPGGPENSGMFLAAKVNNEWQLLHDGQGAYSCSMIEPYNFPPNMINDCYAQ